MRQPTEKWEGEPETPPVSTRPDALGPTIKTKI